MLSELEITSRASTESTLVMIETLGNNYKLHGETAFALFRGQVGEMSAYPYAVTQNAVLKRGDTLVTASSASVWGYKSELEKTMFVQEVSKEQETYFYFIICMVHRKWLSNISSRETSIICRRSCSKVF